MKYGFTKRRGFTLVELLVIVGVIALLVGILLPTVTRARESARVVQCSANLGQVGQALRAWGLSQNSGNTPMRLPDVTIWRPAVATVVKDNTTLSQTSHILFCPNGAMSKYVAGTTPTFNDDQGWVTTNKTYGNGNGHPTPVFTPDPSSNPNATMFTLDIQYQNQANRGTATFTFNKVAGNLWKWVANNVDDGGPSGGKPLKVTWGTDVWNNVVTGQTGTHTLVGGTVASGGTNYGFNYEMSRAFLPKNGRVLLMDYDKLIVDYDGLNADDDDANAFIKKAARHNGKRHMNALMTDCSVQLLTVKELTATTNIFHNR